MKSFNDYLTEANYKRFLKKNRNLSDDEQEEINKYFTKTNPQAGSKINWQSRDTRNMTYDDFLNIMIKYKSGFKKKLKVKVPGRQGEDYWQIKLKTKGFLAYIPLNPETANFFNSGKFGTCEGSYCIGDKDDPQYWDQHMIDDQEVPVYIVDGSGKWVVMIEDDNRDFEIWDKYNQLKTRTRNKESIPGFSVKKELLNSKVRKLYDEIREEFYTDDERHEEAEPDFSDAQEDYDNIVNGMEEAQQELDSGREEQEAEMSKIKEDTLEVYAKKRDAAQEISDEFENEKDAIDEYQDENEAPYMYKGKEYTEDDFDDLLSQTTDDFDEAYDVWNELDDAYNEIEGLDTHEMYENHDEYEWTDDVPDEDGQYEYEQNINLPDANWYDDYFEWNENYGGGEGADDMQTAIWEYVYEGGWGSSAQSTLEKAGFYRP